MLLGSRAVLQYDHGAVFVNVQATSSASFATYGCSYIHGMWLLFLVPLILIQSLIINEIIEPQNITTIIQLMHCVLIAFSILSLQELHLSCIKSIYYSQEV